MRRAGQAPATATPAPAVSAEAQMAEDEAMARRLQEEFDAEG